jgi:hypothetical protein
MEWGGYIASSNHQKSPIMKIVPFHFRILLMTIIATGSSALPDDALGQVTSFQNTCVNVANATGNCSAAIGDDADASADNSVAIGTGSVASATDAIGIAGTASGVSALSFGGYAIGSSSVAIGKSTASGPGALSVGANAIAYGDDSYAFGEQVKSSATNSMVFGRGISGVSPLDNGDASTLMLGMNSNVPTFYMTDAGGSSGAYSNIGIATTSPSSRLHVNGDVRLGVSSGTIGRTVWHNTTNTNTVTLESGTTTSSYTLKLPTAGGSTNDFLQLGASGQLQWASAGSVTGAWMLIGNSGTSASTNFLGTTDPVDLVFRTSNLERMRVLSGGNVGIGTTSPVGTLHLDDNDSDTDLIIERSGSTEANLRFNVGSNPRARIGLESSEVDLYYDHLLNGRDHIFRIGHSDYGSDYEVARIEGSTANVGIGESSPGAKLHVMAEHDESSSAIIGRWGIRGIGEPMFLQIANQELSSTDFAPILQGTTNVSDNAGFFFRGMLYDHNIDTGTDPVMKFSVRRNLTNDNVLIKTRPLFQFANNNDPIMTIIPVSSGTDANVGIGTTTPSYKLDVQGGEINASGNVNSGGIALTSDEMFKTDIDSIESALTIIEALRPKTYFMDTVNYNGEGKFNFKSARQYGFIAQEIESVLPELVILGRKSAVIDSTGNVLIDSYTYRSLNYIGLIPILTKGIQELEFENANLRSDLMELQNQMQDVIQMISACCDQPNASFRLLNDETTEFQEAKEVDVTLADLRFVVLDQNVPNPFAERTSIQFSVPNTAVKAQILFHNAQGQLVQSVMISERGNGVLNVFASDLSNGTYTYSLVIDGNVVDSKRMVKAE